MEPRPQPTPPAPPPATAAGSGPPPPPPHRSHAHQTAHHPHQHADVSAQQWQQQQNRQWNAAVAAQAQAEQASAGAGAEASDPVGPTRKRKGNEPQRQQPQPQQMQDMEKHAYGAALQAHPANSSVISNGAPSSSSAASGVTALSHPPSVPLAHACAVLTLGIETADDTMCCVIPRGTRLPCTSTQLFSTYADQQPGVSIMVYQGERASTKHNQFLGRLDLLGIRSAPRGVPRIEVTFTLDAYGSLRVTAHESLHGSVQALTVQCQFEAPVKYWQTAEVNRILRDAELHRVDDEQLMARTAAKSRLEQYAYGLRTSLEQHTWRSLLTSSEAELIHQQHAECVRWLSVHDPDTLRPEDFQRKLDEMQAVCQPIVVKMYEATVGRAAQAPATMSEPYESVMASVAHGSAQQQLQSHAHTPQSHAHTQRREQPRSSAVLDSPGASVGVPAAASSTLAHASMPAPAAAPAAYGSTPAMSIRTRAPQQQLTPQPHPSSSSLRSPAFGLSEPGSGSLLFESPPASHPGTHPSPDYRSFAAGASSLPLMLNGTSSSPLISAMAGSSSYPHWTHPSLLTSPILWSANQYHTQTSELQHTGNGNGSAGGGGAGSSLAAPPHASQLGADMEEAYMDFLTFPNSTTLSLPYPSDGSSELPPSFPLRGGDSGDALASVSFPFERSSNFRSSSAAAAAVAAQGENHHGTQPLARISPELSRLRGGSTDRNNDDDGQSNSR